MHRYLPAKRVIWPLLLLACVASTPAAAQPIDASQGRQLAVEAMASYKAGDYQTALEQFEQARAIYPTGQVLRMTGYTLMAMERWMEAAELLEQALNTNLKPLSPGDAEHVEKNLKEVLKHIAQAQITSSVAGAEVSIDGGEPHELPAKLRLEPGLHSFVIRAAEHDQVQTEKRIEAGQLIIIEMNPTPQAKSEEPKPPPKPKPLPKPEQDDDDVFGWFPYQGPIGLGSAGLGVAFAAAALGTGLYGTSLRAAVQENIDVHNHNYDANCSRNTELCQLDIAMINRDGERAQQLQTAGVALGLTAGALFVAGAVLFVFSDDSPFAKADRDSSDGLSLSCASSLGTPSGILGCVGRF